VNHSPNRGSAFVEQRLNTRRSDVAYRYAVSPLCFWCFAYHVFSSDEQKVRLPLLDVLLTWQLRQERWDNRNIRVGVLSKQLLPSNRRDYTWIVF